MKTEKPQIGNLGQIKGKKDMKQMSVRYAEVKKQAEKICKVTYK
jgi:hypothetical protein